VCEAGEAGHENHQPIARTREQKHPWRSAVASTAHGMAYHSVDCFDTQNSPT
jgi:hypothetical protein